MHAFACLWLPLAPYFGQSVPDIRHGRILSDRRLTRKALAASYLSERLAVWCAACMGSRSMPISCANHVRSDSSQRRTVRVVAVLVVKVNGHWIAPRSGKPLVIR